ncbi:MAG: efflux transporter outer membrane subunit [Gammaproteobacteria bacterium]|nr:efflux transporter outer membrane subunit [Gammaproteobacteria bacterium]
MHHRCPQNLKCKHRSWRGHMASVAVAVLCVSCASQPRVPESAEAVPQNLPDKWASPLPADDQAFVRGWLGDFDAPGLDAVVTEALNANRNLQAAAARVEAARAQATISGAALWPDASLSFSAQRSRRTPSGLAVGSSPAVTRFGLDGNISWEADFWSRLDDQAKAAGLTAEASAADYGAARLSLVASVTQSWFAVAEASAQTFLAEHTVESFRRARNTIDERYRRGLASALDLHLARENVATAESALAQWRRDRDGATRVLETLLGRYPGAALSSDGVLPAVREAVPSGLPSSLLNRRPDLLAAEMRLRAASYRLTAARKNLLPSIQLTTSAGVASSALSNLLDWNRLVWSILGSVTQPLFSGGQLTAERALAAADHRELWATYAQTVLTAFREVETALAAEQWYRDQKVALDVASTEADAAVKLAFEQYGQGLIDIVTLLETQRRAFTAESNRLRTIRQRLDNRVALYLALGGPFEAPTKETKEIP